MNPIYNEPTYQNLSEKGLGLSEMDFDKILTEIKKGVSDTMHFLAIDDPVPPIIFSNEISTLGFFANANAINLRLDYLNSLSFNSTRIEYKDQLVCFVPDKFYVIIKFLTWLRLFGREETIHYYQFHGHPKLRVKFPQELPKFFSPKTLLLSDLEVEARITGDAVAIMNNEAPIWKSIDAYFYTNFPKYYNKSIEMLSLLPKPNLEISFEMENIYT